MLTISHLINQLQSGTTNTDNVLEEVENIILHQFHMETDENHQYLLNLAEAVCLYTPLEEIAKPFLRKLIDHEHVNDFLGQSDIIYERLRGGPTPSLPAPLADESAFSACNNHLFTYVSHEHLPHKTFVHFKYHGEFVTADVHFEFYTLNDLLTVFTFITPNFDTLYHPLVNYELNDFSQLLKEKIWNEPPHDVPAEEKLHRIIHSYGKFDQPRTIHLLQACLSDPPYDDDVFGSAFCLATKHHYNDIALFILHHKPSVLTYQDSLSTAVNSINQRIFDELLLRNVDINQLDEYGNTPIFSMNHILVKNRKEVINNNIDMIHHLASLGINVNHTNMTGITPFLLAMRMNKIRFAETLFDLGADINALNVNGKGCIDCFTSFLDMSGYEHYLDVHRPNAIKEQVQFLEKIKNQLSPYNLGQLSAMYTKFDVDIDKLTFDEK